MLHRQEDYILARERECRGERNKERSRKGKGGVEGGREDRQIERRVTKMRNRGSGIKFKERVGDCEVLHSFRVSPPSM